MRTLFLVTLIVAGAVSVGAQSSQTPSALTLKDIHGRPLNLKDYRGKVVLMNFWATWCQPCRTEILDLVKKQREYRRRGLQILGITYPPQKASEVRRFAQELRINYPVALGTKETKRLFTASDTLPMTLVIDREGVVRDVIEGIMYEDEFEQKVKPLLVGAAEGRRAPLSRVFAQMPAVRSMKNPLTAGALNGCAGERRWGEDSAALVF